MVASGGSVQRAQELAREFLGRLEAERRAPRHRRPRPGRRRHRSSPAVRRRSRQDQRRALARRAEASTNCLRSPAPIATGERGATETCTPRSRSPGCPVASGVTCDTRAGTPSRLRKGAAVRGPVEGGRHAPQRGDAVSRVRILEQPTDCRRNDAKDESALDDTPATPLTATKTMVNYAENDLSACVGPPGRVPPSSPPGRAESAGACSAHRSATRVGCGGCPCTGRSGRRAPSRDAAGPRCRGRRSCWRRPAA